MTTTIQEAVKRIQSGDHVFIHSVAALPTKLVKAMADRSNELRDAVVYQIHTD